MSEQPETTDDALFDGRVRLRQPAAGYRVAVDPVLLAAAVHPRAGETVLDAGAGVGAAALCLAARVAGVAIRGVEKQGPLAALFAENVERNGFGGRIEVFAEDLRQHRPGGDGRYDQVMTNPPYLAAAAARAPDDPVKRAATVEAGIDLDGWIERCFALLRPKGRLTVIQRADRVAALVAAMSARAGDVRIFPLWPKAGAAARRAIVQARPGVATPGSLLPGLVLHEADGSYTAEADAVLRGGAAIDLAG